MQPQAESSTSSASSAQGVYEQLLSGGQQLQDHRHLRLGPDTIVSDHQVPDLARQAQASQESGLASSGMSAAKLAAADAWHKLGPSLLQQLNSYTEDKGVGPWQGLADPVFELLRYGRSGEEDRAKRLKEILTGFAEQYNVQIDSLMQLPALLDLKRQRNHYAHPLDTAKLQQMLGANEPELSGVSRALQLLLNVSQAPSTCTSTTAMPAHAGWLGD